MILLDWEREEVLKNSIFSRHQSADFDIYLGSLPVSNTVNGYSDWEVRDFLKG